MNKLGYNNNQNERSFLSVQNLSDLHIFIGELDMPASRKAPIRSAIKRVDELIGHGALDLPADPAAIFEKLKVWTPAMANMSHGSFANMKSRLRHGFRLADNTLCNPRKRGRLTGDWKVLHCSLDTPAQRKLSRLMHYAHANGWKPANVCDALIARFEHHLRKEAMIVHPDPVVRSTIAAWNRLPAAQVGMELSMLTPPKPKRVPYWVAVDQWPDALRKDFENVLQRLSAANVYGGKHVRKLKPSTVSQYGNMIRTLVSAAVGGGIKLTDLPNLKSALRPDVVASALTYLAQRANGEASPTMLQMMIRVTVLADMLGLPDDEREEIDAMLHDVEGKVKPKQQRRAMARKNRKLLDRLESDTQFSDLVQTLPDHLAKKARTQPKKRSAPALMRSAIAIEFLLTCSMRRENLATLELGKSLKRIGNAPNQNWVIELDGECVKNGETLRYTLPNESARLLEEYLEHWRGRLCAIPNSWLFPNAKGEMFSARSLASAITEHSRRILGTAITPHQFRHISAESYLLEHPEKLQLMSEHLGHRDTNTTRYYYARSKQKQASREYQEHVLKARDTAHKRLRMRKPKQAVARKEHL